VQVWDSCLALSSGSYGNGLKKIEKNSFFPSFCTCLCTINRNGLKYSRFFILYRNIFAFLGDKVQNFAPRALYLLIREMAQQRRKGGKPQPIQEGKLTTYIYRIIYI